MPLPVALERLDCFNQSTSTSSIPLLRQMAGSVTRIEEGQYSVPPCPSLSHEHQVFVSTVLLSYSEERDPDATSGCRTLDSKGQVEAKQAIRYPLLIVHVTQTSFDTDDCEHHQHFFDTLPSYGNRVLIIRPYEELRRQP